MKRIYFSIIALTIAATPTAYAEECGCDETETRREALTVPWMGWAAGSKKVAVLLVKKEVANSKFEIRDSRLGKTVMSGSAEHWGEQWCGECERHFYTIDISKLKEPGKYYVECAGHKSHPFSVGGSAYLKMDTPQGDFSISTIFESFLAYQRCYAEKCIKKDCGEMEDPSPGFHCVDDSKSLPIYRCTQGFPEKFAPLKPAARSGDLGGGYHDATSTDKETAGEGRKLRDLCWAYEFSQRAEDRKLLLAEIAWGADYLLKIQKPNGAFYLGVKPHVWQKWAEDHFPRMVVDSDNSGVVAVAARGLAAASISLRESDPGRAAKCLASAEKGWDYIDANPDNFHDRYPGWWRGSAGDVLGAAMELARAKREKPGGKYYREAEKRIMAGHWHPGGWWAGKDKSFPGELTWEFDEMMYACTVRGLARFSQLAEPKLKAKIAEHCEAWREHWLKRLDTPYGIPSVIHGVNYWGTMPYFLQFSGDLLMIGTYLGDERSWKYGEKALGWVAGNNPWDLSFIVGLGEWKEPLNLFERPYEGSRGGTTPAVMDRDKDGIPAIASNNKWRETDDWERWELSTEIAGSLALCMALVLYRYG